MASPFDLQKFDSLIRNALAEDIGPGDYTTLATVGKTHKGKASLRIKDEGILAGMDLAEYIFLTVDSSAVFTRYKNDGDTMAPGETAFKIESTAYTILTCERFVLNCMQRMSGIATLTRAYADKIKEYSSILLDTRKTTPNFRLAEKWAVQIGGGRNHRFGLYDMILLKDNHIDFCGGIREAILRTARFLENNQLDLKIEIEARSLQDVQEILDTGRVHRIMLDNFSVSAMKEAVRLIGDAYETEASGGISLSTIAEYAATGVRFISAGAIIHQAKSLDLSLEAIID